MWEEIELAWAEVGTSKEDTDMTKEATLHFNLAAFHVHMHHTCTRLTVLQYQLKSCNAQNSFLCFIEKLWTTVEGQC